MCRTSQRQKHGEMSRHRAVSAGGGPARSSPRPALTGQLGTASPATNGGVKSIPRIKIVTRGANISNSRGPAAATASAAANVVRHPDPGPSSATTGGEESVDRGNVRRQGDDNEVQFLDDANEDGDDSPLPASWPRPGRGLYAALPPETGDGPLPGSAAGGDKLLVDEDDFPAVSVVVWGEDEANEGRKVHDGSPPPPPLFHSDRKSPQRGVQDDEPPHDAGGVPQGHQDGSSPSRSGHPSSVGPSVDEGRGRAVEDMDIVAGPLGPVRDNGRGKAMEITDNVTRVAEPRVQPLDKGRGKVVEAVDNGHPFVAPAAPPPAPPLPIMENNVLVRPRPPATQASPPLNIKNEPGSVNDSGSVGGAHSLS